MLVGIILLEALASQLQLLGEFGIAAAAAKKQLRDGGRAARVSISGETAPPDE